MKPELIFPARDDDCLHVKTVYSKAMLFLVTTIAVVVVNSVASSLDNNNNNHHSDLNAVRRTDLANINSTNDDKKFGSELQFACLKPLMDDAPLRCPNNYHLLYWNGWNRLCRPAACVEVRYTQNFPRYASANVCIEHINRLKSSAKICTNNTLRDHSSHYKKCPKILLSENQYEIQENGSLFNSLDGTLLPLSEYFISNNKSAIICKDGKKNGHGHSIAPFYAIPWCVPISDASTESTEVDINTLRAAGHVVLTANNATASACVTMPTRLSECQNIQKSYWNSFEIDDTQTLNDLVTLVKYKFGDYVLDLNRSAYYYCGEDTFREVIVKNYIFGSASVLSAVCIVLTLLVHVLYPRVNYHMKSLLCHAFSLLILFILSAIVRFWQGIEGRFVFVSFSIQYLALLTAFLWLNGMAFHLWRCFSTLQTSTIGGKCAKQVGHNYIRRF